jgi:hypothetical protein
MNGEPKLGCEQVRELAAELAIGVADGQERDAALRHAATCADCRRLVAELAAVADELLLLAPAQQPPPGFAARTAARLVHSTAAARRDRRRRRAGIWPVRVQGGRRVLARLAVAASLLAALGLGAGAAYLRTAGDRQLAQSYRSVLAQGHGSFFAAAPLQGPPGTRGTVFGYQGEPSWLFATLTLPGTAPQRFDVWLVTRDGRQHWLGQAVLGGSDSTWGSGIPVALTEVTQLRFVATGGQPAVVAYFNARDPWRSR